MKTLSTRTLLALPPASSAVWTPIDTLRSVTPHDAVVVTRISLRQFSGDARRQTLRAAEYAYDLWRAQEAAQVGTPEYEALHAAYQEAHRFLPYGAGEA